MKKKMYVMMMLVFWAISSGMSDEIMMGPNINLGLVNSWSYYFRNTGNTDRKLDWQSFYDRMKKIADSGVYKYIYVGIENNDPAGNDILFHVLTTNDHKVASGKFVGEAPIFSYISQTGQGISMLFSNEYYSDAFYDYASAVKKWNYYLDLL